MSGDYPGAVGSDRVLAEEVRAFSGVKTARMNLLEGEGAVVHRGDLNAFFNKYRTEVDGDTVIVEDEEYSGRYRVDLGTPVRDPTGEERVYVSVEQESRGPAELLLDGCDPAELAPNCQNSRYRYNVLQEKMDGVRGSPRQI